MQASELTHSLEDQSNVSRKRSRKRPSDPASSDPNSTKHGGHFWKGNARDVGQQQWGDTLGLVTPSHPAASLLHNNVSIDKGQRFVWVGQQKPLPEKTSVPAKILAAQHGGYHCTAVDVQPTPAAKLVSLPSFSSSASTLDQLLSLSPSSTEAHSMTFCASWDGHSYQHQHLRADALSTMGHRLPNASEPSRGTDQHQYLCADALNTMGHRTPTTLEPSRGPDQLALSGPSDFASGHQKQPCSDPHSSLGSTSVWSDFPSDVEDLLDWAAAGVDLGPPVSLPANTPVHPGGSPSDISGLQHVMPTMTSDQTYTLQYATTMDEVPDLACCDGWASTGLMDAQTHADVHTLPALHDMYATLEQPSLHSPAAHDETASLHIMHNLAQQDTLSTLSSDCAAQLPQPPASEQTSACPNEVAEAQTSGLLLQTHAHHMSHAGATAASLLFSDMPETEVDAQHEAVPLFSDMPGVEVDALLAASSMSCELDALLASTSASSTAQSEPAWLQLDDCIAAQPSTDEHSTAQDEASWLQHEEITQHNTAQHSTAKLPTAQNGAAWLKLDRTASNAQVRQAGYSSGSGCGGEDGGAAADQEAAARKRRGGRPRVYDLDQPIISDLAATNVPKPRGRGAKPKYVYGTPEEAIAKRRKRNRDTANNSYLKRKQHTMAMKQQIEGLKVEGAALSKLLQLLQQLSPADHVAGWVHQQLISGRSPEVVSGDIMQRIAMSLD